MTMDIEESGGWSAFRARGRVGNREERVEVKRERVGFKKGREGKREGGGGEV